MSYPVRRPGWDPLADLEALRAEMGRLLGGMLGQGGPGTGAEQRWSRDVEVDEGSDAWTVTARLAGFASDEVTVELDGDRLRIRGTTGGDEEGSRRRTAVDYRLTVPSDVDGDRVDATMDHGLLRITLPRRTRASARQIKVQQSKAITDQPRGSAGDRAAGSAGGQAGGAVGEQAGGAVGGGAGGQAGERPAE